MYGIIEFEGKKYVLTKTDYDQCVRAVENCAVSGGLATVGESEIKRASEVERERNPEREPEPEPEPGPESEPEPEPKTRARSRKGA